MKVTYRIPSKDPYGYVEIEVEGKGNGQEAIDELEQMMAYQKGEHPDLDVKEWNPLLVDYLNGKPLHPDTYFKLSPRQQYTIQELKKAFKRMTPKEDIE